MDAEYRTDHASNYVGKIFTGTDSLRSARRGNPMNDGADMAALQRVQDRIDMLRNEGQLPSGYDVHNPVQLLPDRVFDTSNRATVLQAQLNRFDPDGFKRGQPLRKTLFYLDPFVTCSWCNFVSFIDVMTVRRTLAMPEESREMGLPMESLPPCRRCGKADHFEVGSHDFSEMIANRERLAREKLLREMAAAAVILRSYRAYLRRMYANAAAKAAKALAALQSKAATKINNSARRRLAYRRITAERDLRETRTCNPVLMAWALKPYKRNNLRTFWFARDVESKLAYRDYLELGARMGWEKTRRQLEDNFAELSRRIVERKFELLALIQRVWRGVMARRIVKLYRKELIRLGQFVLSRVLIIQRAYRGHFVRLRIIPVMRHEKVREERMESYLKEAEQVRAERIRDDMKIKTRSAYIKDRAEERTARFTGRIDVPSEHDNRKMKAWKQSIYQDQRLTKNVTALLQRQLAEIRDTKMDIEAQLERKDFLTGRIAEHGPEGFGKRGLLPEMELNIVNGFLVGPEMISSRSKGMKTLMQPEVKQIMQGVIDRAVHDFRGNNLLSRFREYNKAREPDPDLAAKLEVARAKFGANAKVYVKKKLNQRFRSEYKFPAGINDDPMACLDEDLDATLQLQDIRKKERAGSEFSASMTSEREKIASKNSKKR